MKCWAEAAQSKYIMPDALQSVCAALREEGKTIATVNGSFDILHAGHLYQLYEASMQADVLICALNTDASIAKYKSSDRPFIPLEYRLQLMAALVFVDYVTYFDERTPEAFIAAACPDVHVNGVEYGAQCVEADIVKKVGARLHLVDRIPSLSTTELIEKIQKTCVLSEK